MKYEKPELTEVQRKRGNDIYKYLYRNGTCTKKELCEFLGWKYNNSNDRRIRELLAIIGKKTALLSTPDQKGYKLASPNKLEEVEHQWKYFDKILEEIKERRQPLIDFYEKHKQNIQN